MLVRKQNGAKQKMAESYWMVCAHGVSEARVHGVPCAWGLEGPCAWGVLGADEKLRIRGEFPS